MGWNRDVMRTRWRWWLGEKRTCWDDVKVGVGLANFQDENVYKCSSAIYYVNIILRIPISQIMLQSVSARQYHREGNQQSRRVGNFSAAKRRTHSIFSFLFFSSVVTTTRQPLRHSGETRNPFHVRSSPSAWSSTCFSHNFYIRVWPQSLHSRSGEKEEKKTSLRSNPASLPFKASDLSNLSAPARRTSFRRDM